MFNAMGHRESVKYRPQGKILKYYKIIVYDPFKLRVNLKHKRAGRTEKAIVATSHLYLQWSSVICSW